MDFTYKPALKYGPNELKTMDLWALIVKTGSTAGLEDEAATIADFTNLEEFDSETYGRIQLTNVDCIDDAGGDRWGKLVCDPLEWENLGIPSDPEEEALGIVIYAEQGTPWDEYDEYPIDGEDTRIPIMFKDSGGFPIGGVNGPVTWTPSVEGVTYEISTESGV